MVRVEEEGKLSEGQAGSRKGRGTMEQVFVSNTIIGNRLKRKGRKLHVAFVDFAAVFDKVNRGTLWKKMQKMGIKGRFLNMLNIHKRFGGRIKEKERGRDRYRVSE